MLYSRVSTSARIGSGKRNTAVNTKASKATRAKALSRDVMVKTIIG